MKERIERHKDGSIRAKGHMKDGELEGYWEWLRKTAPGCVPDILSAANRSANGRPTTPGEKSSKSRRRNPPVER